AKLTLALSIHTYAACLDRTRPLLDLTLDEVLKVLLRLAFRRGQLSAQFRHSSPHNWIVHGGNGGNAQALHNDGWRALRKEQSVPEVCFEVFEALFMGRCQIGKD